MTGNQPVLVHMNIIFLFVGLFVCLFVCLSDRFGLVWLVEIERVLSGAKDGQRDESSGAKKFCDVTKDKPIKVTVRTSVPTRDHPKVRRTCSQS